MKKTFTNLEIAELLRSIAAAYKLKDEKKNLFKTVAYERAADSIEHATSELKDLWDDGKLDTVPSVGTSMVSHLDELFRTGKSKHFEEVLKGLPPIMFKFMELPGIGAKTAYRLTKELGLKSLSDLKKAAEKGQIARLEGFGEKSEKDILTSLSENQGKVKRKLLPYALTIAQEIIEYMKTKDFIKKADTLGSLRRMAATIGDIDVAVATSDPAGAINHFVNFPKAQRVIEQGERTASILFPGNVRVDLMAEKPESYGALLQHFTGSKNHNIALREYALKKGLSVSDYGIYLQKGKGKTYKMGGDSKKLKKFDNEVDFYNFLGLDYIPPELREDTGEIKAALEHKLPKLVELDDIHADFHIHSNFDVETSHDLGETGMEEIVKYADSRGYEYIAFSEHNPSQKGHTDADIQKILENKQKTVDALNLKLPGMTKNLKKVFNSLEIDILPSGKLPLNDTALATLDFALVSIHSSFRQPKDEMTKRVLLALSHPKSKIFAHPTARKLNEREGIDLDWVQIMDFMSKNNKWLEINCDSMWLDLPDVLVREAVKKGVKLTFGTDSHHVKHLDNIPWGLSVARRGWATKADIVNTYGLSDFEKMLQ